MAKITKRYFLIFGTPESPVGKLIAHWIATQVQNEPLDADRFLLRAVAKELRLRVEDAASPEYDLHRQTMSQDLIERGQGPCFWAYKRRRRVVYNIQWPADAEGIIGVGRARRPAAIVCEGAPDLDPEKFEIFVVKTVCRALTDRSKMEIYLRMEEIWGKAKRAKEPARTP